MTLIPVKGPTGWPLLPFTIDASYTDFPATDSTGGGPKAAPNAYDRFNL
jgi:hypothetical protein